jgi:hypothetical protein
MGKRKSKEGGESRALVLLALIALMMCAGGWNYHRNLSLEADDGGVRSFKGYSDEALEQLAEAYAEEADALRRRYESAMARRQGTQHKNGLLGEKVKEFERVRRDGDKIRAVNAMVAEKEARLRDIREEQGLRRNTSEYNVHLRRLTSI